MLLLLLLLLFSHMDLLFSPPSSPPLPLEQLLRTQTPRSPDSSPNTTAQTADFDGSGTLDREEFVEICHWAWICREEIGRRRQKELGVFGCFGV